MISVLTPTGTLGYGFDPQALARGMGFEPHVIAVDAGSTDPGPACLGSAQPLCARRMVKEEITQLLGASRRAGIPLVIGSRADARYAVRWDWGETGGRSRRMPGTRYIAGGAMPRRKGGGKGGKRGVKSISMLPREGMRHIGPRT